MAKLSDFYFDLPEDRIAQYPEAERGRSRLMVLDRSKGSREHRMVGELPALLERGSLLVFNNSRVRRARLSGRALDTGAGVEFLLLEKQYGDGTLWKAMVRRARRRRVGSRYVFAGGENGGTADGKAGGREAEIAGEEGEFKVLRFDRPVDDDWLDLHGHIPLPPYIKREDRKLDGERYQTVYAAETGSTAAPTAGLHFSRELLKSLEDAGIETAFITLHVGLGTFLPVRTENIEDHLMHRESYTISGEAASRIEKAREEGRNIVAVGTTSVRTLESACLSAGSEPLRLRRGEGSTALFIYPGYRFKVADQIFTNFHTPGSTLLMLVSAFAGRDFILESYGQAIREGYRFFSYGDAMLIR
ncbi:MAG: tRNA preQ1(34) S-adenosylmethionine ribosyltransferase-isomerase QueA [Treponema sp.]|nr:tRNA preQ1(34) S-adenosylmethionine ribosyltransferase-isomerase QueA [Treponema sp.]